MNISIISKYYDLRYDFHKSYTSPVEFKKALLKEKAMPRPLKTDSVYISKNTLIKHTNLLKR